jgi:hypothetical protein
MIAKHGRTFAKTLMKLPAKNVRFLAERAGISLAFHDTKRKQAIGLLMLIAPQDFKAGMLGAKDVLRKSGKANRKWWEGGVDVVGTFPSPKGFENAPRDTMFCVQWPELYKIFL